MSESTNDPADQTTEPAAKVESKPNNIEAIEAKKMEALAEAKKAKEEARELKAKLEAIENEKLESQGKYADINKSLKEKLSDYEKKLETTNKTYAYNTVTSVIKQKALEMGAVNADKVIKLMDKSDMELISVDESYNVDMDAVSSVLEKMKKDHEDIALFKKQVPRTKDATPNPSHFQNNNSDKTYKSMSLAELKAEYINKGLKK